MTWKAARVAAAARGRESLLPGTKIAIYAAISQKFGGLTTARERDAGEREEFYQWQIRF
jgi:hypothetical protein